MVIRAVGVLAGIALTMTAPIAALAQDSRSGFTSDAILDTVVTVGGAAETNPLLLYTGLSRVQLIDSTTVLYSDFKGGRVAAVDLLTGRGWEVDDSGASGPGEYGGKQPWFSASGETIHFAAQNGQGSTRSRDGALLEAWRYPEPFFGLWGAPEGLLQGAIIVAHRHGFPDLGRAEAQRMDQAIRAYHPATGLIWSRSLNPLIANVTESGSFDVGGPGKGIAIAARHGTVVFFQSGQTWVVALNSDGSERARIDLGHEAASRGFVDAQERIWIATRTRNEMRGGSYVVLDRDLRFVMNVVARTVRDAWGDYLVTTSDQDGLDFIHLLKRRR